mmetsp:Transcript_1071/g.1503  ORF Transcript_1071/g.1503 Transcript_1071/m.1503 type:complete len:219 (+) Transcript_1071:108-764(+)
MKGLIQKVKSASVTVDGKIVSKINRGLLVLLGIQETDKIEDLEYVCRKALNCRLFDKKGKPWGQSVMGAELEVLVVSQFTLYAKMKGNKPDFHLAMKSNRSEPMYDYFLELARKTYRPDRVFGGEFGAMMDIALVNDGPVTIEICSDGIEHRKSKAKIDFDKKKPVSEPPKDTENSSATCSDNPWKTAAQSSLAGRFLWNPLLLGRKSFFPSSSQRFH